MAQPKKKSFYRKTVKSYFKKWIKHGERDDLNKLRYYLDMAAHMDDAPKLQDTYQ